MNIRVFNEMSRDYTEYAFHYSPGHHLGRHVNVRYVNVISTTVWFTCYIVMSLNVHEKRGYRTHFFYKYIYPC